MQFREQQSSTCSHGFRIEAMKLSGEPPITDLKKVKSHEEVFNTLKLFINDSNTRQNLVKKLENLRSKVENCEYFQTHEVTILLSTGATTFLSTLQEFRGMTA